MSLFPSPETERYRLSGLLKDLKEVSEKTLSYETKKVFDISKGFGEAVSQMREVLYWMNCGELTLLLLNLGAQRLSGQTYFKEVSQRTLQSHTDRPITESLFKRWPRPYQHNLGRGELDSRHRDQRLEEVRWSF